MRRELRLPRAQLPQEDVRLLPEGRQQGDDLGESQGEGEQKEKANLSPFAAAFERGRKSFDGWVKEAGDKKKQKEEASLFPNRFEERTNRFGVVLPALPMEEER